MAKEEKEFVKEITPRSQDFSQWYVDVILKADLADYAPVRGSIVMKPYGYAIWESIQAELDRRFKATGVQNAYFPMFIPESILSKEAEHIEGFAPEVPWVTEVGKEKLPERLAIRPTSETIIHYMYSQWIQSWRDLPVVLNQWCSVVRWEKATRPFLRTTEFLWQEGHTAHRTEEEAEARTLQMLEVYRSFVQEHLAIPVIPGRKTETEKFAGAVRTYSIEALMGDGKALQAATSHNLGQGFARVFDITFLDSDGQLKHVWQTSWGASHRLIGALIMVHGDDRGLVLPPRVAPIQVVIVPITTKKAKDEVLERARQLAQDLGKRFRVKLDDREEQSPGWKFNDWEMRGVPLRLELGPRDLAANEVVLVRRDSGEKISVSQTGLLDVVAEVLESVQESLFLKAKRFLEENTRSVSSYDEFKRVLEERRGFIRAGWCGESTCERAIKEETGATIRNIPLEGSEPHGETCLHCGQPARHVVYFARAY